MRLRFAAVVSLAVSLSVPAFAADPHPHILQQPSISRDLIAFSYAGDLWTVPRAGGRARHLTTGVGIESQPVFSPDGQTIAFTGEYDGNTDVFTIPAAGGIPKRITYHPAADVAVGWTPDGKNILFRSTRDSESSGASRRFSGDEGNTLSRYVLDGRKTEKLAEHVISYELSADGEKMLLKMGKAEEGENAPPAGGEHEAPKLFIVSATAPVKAGEGAVALNDLEVKVDPPAEWRQMYHEIWRIERAYFYDPHYHGVNTVEEEARFEPYVDSVASRADLNYIFQEMLTGFSVGHLRGHGGEIPEAQHVPGGLLGADYTIDNNRWCIAKIYTGGTWSPMAKAPLAQPGLNVHAGDCILAINGQELTAATNIQEPLEGTAGHAVTLHIGGANGDGARDVTVVPVPNEQQLRNLDWIDANQRKVDELSGGKLAYVYLPDTGANGFTSFNRYFMAQTNKEGVIVDERYNGGGQVADYIVEVLGRKIEAYWAPRYGAIEHTPNAGIYGPKVMIINESAGSGGDALPWLFKHNKLGTVVGKRTWGGLVGIGEIPVLMDGAQVTSPSVAFFSPAGKWEVENHGVDPDVVVEQDPKAVAEGRDPQLEKAVVIALEQLKQNPPPEPHKPAYPNYHEK